MKPFQNKTPAGTPIPVALIGFMGRDDNSPKGLGSLLLHDAALRVRELQTHIGVWGIFLHAENTKLVDWYAEQGFYKAESTERGMYAPISKLLDA